MTMWPERIEDRRRLAALGWVVLLAVLAVGLPVLAHAAAGTYPPVTGAISGPSIVGEGLTAQYIVNGTGGPAFGQGGTAVGSIAFNATLSGNNVSGASIQPATGVLVNGQTTLQFRAPNASEIIKLRVVLTSSASGQNATLSLNMSIRIVAPYVLSGTLQAGPTAVSGFDMTVTVDGTPVGQVAVPAIAANGTYHFSFDYAPPSLSAGWHTIAVSVAPQHGLVTFTGGVEQLTLQFYVTSPPPDYALDVGVGIAAFAAAVFIWGSVVGARRRGRRVR